MNSTSPTETLAIRVLWVAGVILACAIAVAAQNVATFVGQTLLGFSKSPISSIMMAIIIGAIIGNALSIPQAMRPGLKFCASTILRIGIMLLGIRLSLVSAGLNSLLALPFVLSAITVGILTVKLFGKSLGLSRPLCGLVAVGTSICGVTAIVATAPIIKANESEVSYAIACITVFGIAAMFLYPFIAHFLFPTKPILAGLFLGTSIHETAQVAGAGLMYQTKYNAPEAFDMATITKLVRNLCMIAVIPIVGILYSKESSSIDGKTKLSSMVPWFIVGFVGMSAIRTVGEIGERPFGFLQPQQWEVSVALLRQSAEHCLLIAMSAIGATSAFSSIKEIGFKPFLLGLFAATVVGGASLLLIVIFGDMLVQNILG